MFGSSEDRARQLAARHKKNRVSSNSLQGRQSSTNVASQTQQQTQTAFTSDDQPQLSPAHHPLPGQTNFNHYVQPVYGYGGQVPGALISRSSLRAQQFQMDQHRIQNEYMSHIIYGNPSLPNLIVPPLSHFTTTSHPASYAQSPSLAPPYQWVARNVNAEPLNVNAMGQIRLDSSPLSKSPPPVPQPGSNHGRTPSYPESDLGIQLNHPPEWDTRHSGSETATANRPLRVENTTRRNISEPSPIYNSSRIERNNWLGASMAANPTNPPINAELLRRLLKMGQDPQAIARQSPVGFYSTIVSHSRSVQRHSSQPDLGSPSTTYPSLTRPVQQPPRPHPMDVHIVPTRFRAPPSPRLAPQSPPLSPIGIYQVPPRASPAQRTACQSDPYPSQSLLSPSSPILGPFSAVDPRVRASPPREHPVQRTVSEPGLGPSQSRPMPSRRVSSGLLSTAAAQFREHRAGMDALVASYSMSSSPAEPVQSSVATSAHKRLPASQPVQQLSASKHRLPLASAFPSRLSCQLTTYYFLCIPPYS